MSLVVSFAVPRLAEKLPNSDWMKYLRSRVWSNQRSPAVRVQLSLGEKLASPNSAICSVLWSLLER